MLLPGLIGSDGGEALWFYSYAQYPIDTSEQLGERQAGLLIRLPGKTQLRENGDMPGHSGRHCWNGHSGALLGE